MSEETERPETYAMGEALRADLVQWGGQYGFARLGPFLVGVGISMVEQAAGHPAAVDMLQGILDDERFR